MCITVDRSQTSLDPKKLVGSCAARESKEEQRYRTIADKVMEKAMNSGIYHTRCPSMKLGTILCNKCYCAIVESKKSNNNNWLSVQYMSKIW